MAKNTGKVVLQHWSTDELKANPQLWSAAEIFQNIWRRKLNLASDWLESYFGTFSSRVSDKECDQKKSPNVYKSCLKMISLEKW